MATFGPVAGRQCQGVAVEDFAQHRGAFHQREYRAEAAADAAAGGWPGVGFDLVAEQWATYQTQVAALVAWRSWPDPGVWTNWPRCPARPEGRLRWYVVAGLLHQQPGGDFEPDSLHRMRLMQFARSRGVSDEQLAAATARQGDLLGIFEEFDLPAQAGANLADVARQLGLDDAVIDELAELLDWHDVGAGTESDIATLRVIAKALALGMPRDAMMQIVHILADTMDRLADGVVRTFHDYVHERYRAQGSLTESC